MQDKWLEVSSVSREYLQSGLSCTFSSAYMTDELEDLDDFTVSART